MPSGSNKKTTKKHTKQKFQRKLKCHHYEKKNEEMLEKKFQSYEENIKKKIISHQ